MNLVLDIATSVDFWRRVYPVDRAPRSPLFLQPQDCASSQAEVWELAPAWLTPEFLESGTGRLHALAFDRACRRVSASHVTHTWSGPIPEGSFYQLNPNVYVMSPGFMFLMAASLLNQIELIAFGDELCGLYGFDPTEDRGFRKRTAPIASQKKLDAYLRGAAGCAGHRRATTALSYVIDNSASPMETFDEMTMCLPVRLGGYHMPRPEMNHPVPLDQRAARIAKRKTCYADMCYPLKKLDIEHHGKYDHSSPEDVAADRARVNGLKEMKFEVIELTAEQVGDPLAYEYIIERIAQLLGRRLRKEALGIKPQRSKLRNDLFAWNQSSGQIRKTT